MGIFKILSDGWRFRCNRYRAPGDRHCAHKINLPRSGQSSFDSVVNPQQIRLIAGQVQTVFCWSRMRFSPTTVALALYFSFLRALPAPSVVATLQDLFRIQVSHDTITRWSHKAAFLLADKWPLTLPPPVGRKPRLLADETQFRCRGHKRWFWLTYLPRYDLYLGHNLSARRDTQAARDALAMTYHRYPQLKRSPILTDGLWSYASALGDLQIPARAHRVYLSFFEEPNNNSLERKWSNFKTRARPFRGFKSDLGLAAFVQAQILYHNLFKPSGRLQGQTPAQALGLALPKASSDWFRLSHLLTS
jgi:transposase-like protein